MRRLSGRKAHLQALAKSPLMRLASSVNKFGGSTTAAGHADTPDVAGATANASPAEADFKALAAQTAANRPGGRRTYVAGVPGLSPIRYANAAGREAMLGLGASSGAGAYNRRHQSGGARATGKGSGKGAAMAQSASLPALGPSTASRPKATSDPLEGGVGRGGATRLPPLNRRVGSGTGEARSKAMGKALNGSHSAANLRGDRPPPSMRVVVE